MNDEDRFDRFEEFMEAFCDPAETDFEIIIGTMYEGAVQQDMTVVEWICRAINMQFVRDCVEKGLAEGTLSVAGENSKGERIIVSNTAIGARH